MDKTNDSAIFDASHARGGGRVDETRGRGRPRWVPTARELEQAEELAKMQCTHGEIAAVLGVSKATVSRRAKDDEGFAAALSRGKARGRVEFGKLLWKHAEEGNPKALGLLAYRFGYVDTRRHEVTGEGGGQVSVQVVVPSNGREPAGAVTQQEAKQVGEAVGLLVVDGLDDNEDESDTC